MKDTNGIVFFWLCGGAFAIYIIIYKTAEMSIEQTINSVLRGVGQVIFQNNALSGALMLVGIGFNSPAMCLFAFLGTLVGTYTAVALGYDATNLRNGLYGYNGTLVGIAVVCFMPINAGSVLLMVVGSAASTVLTHLFERQRLIPALTAPFVLTTWLLLLVRTFVPALQPSGTAAVAADALAPLHALSLNIGQIMLQGESLLTGLFFLLGILVNSRKMALETLASSALCLAVALLPIVDVGAVNSGLYGYNAILAVLGVANILSITSLRYVKALVALVVSVVLQYVGLRMGFVTLTAPFVLSVWLIVVCAARSTRARRNGDKTSHPW